MKEQKSITIIWQDLGKPCPATTSQPSSQSVKVSSSKVTNEKKKQLRAADISTTHNIHKINKQTNKHYNYTTHHNMLIYKKCFTMRKIRAMYTVI